MQCNDVGEATLSTNIDIESYMAGLPYLEVEVTHADRQIKVTRELWEQMSDTQPPDAVGVAGTSHLIGEFVNKNGEFVLDGRANSEHVYEYTGECDDHKNILVFTKLEEK